MLCSVGVSAGKGFMPFLKQCSTCFKAVGPSFEGGHKALPAPGKCNQSMDMYVKIKDIKGGTWQADLSQMGQSAESK